MLSPDRRETADCRILSEFVDGFCFTNTPYRIIIVLEKGNYGNSGLVLNWPLFPFFWPYKAARIILHFSLYIRMFQKIAYSVNNNKYFLEDYIKILKFFIFISKCFAILFAKQEDLWYGIDYRASYILHNALVILLEKSSTKKVRI